MRRTTGASTAAFAATIAIAACAVAVAAQPRAVAQEEPIELSLLTQSFAIVPGGVVHLEYQLSGVIPEPVPISTSSTSTPTSPADTPTTIPAAPPDPAAAPDTTSPPGSTAAPDTTTTTVPTTSSELTVLVTALDPITLRSDVSDVLDGAFRDAIDSATYDLVDVIGAEQNGTTSSSRRLVLEVQTALGGDVGTELELPRAGLYPIRVEVRRGRRPLVEHVTFVERLATPDSGVFPRSTLNLSIVARIPDPGPEPDTLDLVESNARVTELAQLGELIAAPLTVSLPPVVATALDDDPQLAARLRAALSGDEVLALPDSVLDPSSAVAADQVETFTRELREGEDALRRALPTTATRRVAWLTTEPLSTAGASMLRDLGVQLLVVPFDLYLALGSNQPTAIRAALTDPSLVLSGGISGGGALAVSVVDPINALLETDRDDIGTPAEIAAHLFADLMAMRIQLGPDSRSFMLATPDLGIPDPDVLAVIEGFVEEHPDVDFQTLSFVPGSTGPFLINGEQVRVTFPESAGPDLTGRVHEINLVRLRTEEVATMLPTDDPRPPQWRTELESLMSTAIDEAAVGARLDRVEEALHEIEGAIEPPDPVTFTLAGNETTITLRFGNTGTTPLSIVVSVSGPSRLTFPNPETETVLLPGVTTDVTIPIRARSNGTSQVAVQMHTPSGSSIGEPIVLTARVNALSGLGQLLTGAALLVLATWWFSHFRRTRRARVQRDSLAARGGHPSNGASTGVSATAGVPGTSDIPPSSDLPAPSEGPAPSDPDKSDPATSEMVSGSPDSSPPNGDEVSPDAAVASSTLEQTDG